MRNLKFLGEDGSILTAGKSGKVPPGQIKGGGMGGDGSEKFQYFYHPDHLGSTSYITDASGEVYQHLEYFAFGGTFVEEHSNTDRMPYLFNGKELDEETGLYYYGARYYEPKTSVWLSVDPLAEKFTGWSPYNYVTNNPLNVSDPNGADTLLINGGTGKVLGTRTGGEDVVYWTPDEELNDDTWDNSKQLYHALNISGESGGTPSKKGDPVIWSEQKDKSEEFKELMSGSIDIWESYKEAFDDEEWFVPGNEFIEKSRFFANQVNDNTPYDIKNGMYHPKYIGEWSWFEGRLVRYDDYGNMLYGGIGTAFGMSSFYLQMGVNVNQLGKRG